MLKELNNAVKATEIMSIQKYLIGPCYRNPTHLLAAVNIFIFSLPHYLSSAGFQIHPRDHQLNS